MDVRSLALNAADAVFQEDGPALGSCISKYWELKKNIASGCEPKTVSCKLLFLNWGHPAHIDWVSNI